MITKKFTAIFLFTAVKTYWKKMCITKKSCKMLTAHCQKENYPKKMQGKKFYERKNNYRKENMGKGKH